MNRRHHHSHHEDESAPAMRRGRWRGRGPLVGPPFADGPFGPGGFGPGGFGPGGFGPGGFGPGGFGPGGGRGRRGGPGGRARRGNVRAALLALLAERPMHGYEIIQELAQRTEGIWRPSAGSIYPTLQLLEDEGLVAAGEREGRRVFTLTEAGAAAAAAHTGPAPWEEVLHGVDPAQHELHHAAAALAGAVGQVLREGEHAHLAEVASILTEARRRIYSLLAGGEAPRGGEGA